MMRCESLISLCRMCHVEEVSILFLPCGHLMAHVKSTSVLPRGAISLKT